MEDCDDIVVALERIVKVWEENVKVARERVQAVAACGSKDGVREANTLPRLNALAQDSLSKLRLSIADMQILFPQHPSDQQVKWYQKLLEQWQEHYESSRLNLRNANVQAKINIGRSAKEERQMLFSGSKEATLRRRNLETQAGMTAAAENITDSLRRTRQLMIQELDRGSSTLSSLGDSTATLRKAETEYKGQRSLLAKTRNLLTTMTRQDIFDRLILVAGAVFFMLVCIYILQKRIIPFKASRYPPTLLPLQQQQRQELQPEL